MKNIESIIRYGMQFVERTVSIVGITDNGDGTYTVYFSGEMVIGKYQTILLTNCGMLSGYHEIQSFEKKSFVVKYAKDATVNLGTATNIVTFISGSWDKIKTDLDNTTSKAEQLPLIALSMPFTRIEDEQSGTTDYSLDFYFIARSPKTQSNEQKESTSFDYLDRLLYNFKQAIKRTGGIIEIGRTEILNQSFAPNQLNFNSIDWLYVQMNVKTYSKNLIFNC